MFPEVRSIMHTANDFVEDKINRWVQVMLAKAEAPALANQIFQSIVEDQIYEKSKFFFFHKEQNW